jgi:hypothetical protein
LVFGVAPSAQAKSPSFTKDAAHGVGKTVVETAKAAGDKVEQSGLEAKPEAKDAWRSLRDGVAHVGRSIRDFFHALFAH